MYLRNKLEVKSGLVKKGGVLSSISILFLLSACNPTNYYLNNESKPDYQPTKVKLGEMLFSDKSLSRDGNQSCATCHNSEHAFIDNRVNATSHDTKTPGAVSLGQDDRALGDRNTPTAAYAAFIPDFYFDEAEGLFKGGQFFDGREKNLQGQAGQPFLNPVEMQSTKKSVVSKVQRKYGAVMNQLYGANVFASVDTAFLAITDSITKFEQSDVFSPFDSKFDKVLKGKEQFTQLEATGLKLFKAEDKGNCAACHPVPTVTSRKQDSLFTDFTYDNLGTPRHDKVRTLNGKRNFVDNGLFINPEVNDPNLKGAFRVSTLRNIAVTGPYMHNGIFKDLKTVVHFYNTRDVVGAINPETHAKWKPAEYDVNKNMEELGDLKLTNEEEDAIVAFMKTLTDSRYIHLTSEK